MFKLTIIWPIVGDIGAYSISLVCRFVPLLHGISQMSTVAQSFLHWPRECPRWAMNSVVAIRLFQFKSAIGSSTKQY